MLIFAKIWVVRGEKVRGSCKSERSLQNEYVLFYVVFTCKDRLRYSRERALQSHILIFWHPPPFKIKIQYVKVLCQRPVSAPLEAPECRFLAFARVGVRPQLLPAPPHFGHREKPALRSAEPTERLLPSQKRNRLPKPPRKKVRNSSYHS